LAAVLAAGFLTAAAGFLAGAFWGADFFTGLGEGFLGAGFVGAAFLGMALLFDFTAGLATFLTGAFFAGLAAGFLAAGFFDFAGITFQCLGCR
jgi:hypothetical protein